MGAADAEREEFSQNTNKPANISLIADLHI
jgi:hypothetical protein